MSAHKAYEWCTDYRSGTEDHLLMGEESGQREVQRVADSTVVLTDTFRVEGGTVEKQKLVEMYRDRFSWNATHLTGPAKYSQFLYVITPDSKDTSHIDFNGLFLDYKHENLGKTETEKLAAELCKDDAEGWKLLAKAMAKDYGK